MTPQCSTGLPFQGRGQNQALSIVFFLERQSMFKVVFVLRQIVLRLKECEIEILIKKQKETVLLGSQCKIIDGICNANLTTQFYLSPNDSSLNIQVVILQGSTRKLGGNTVLNLLQWQPNVLHQTISVLNNSPDKQARIFYNFYYFKDNAVVDRRHLFLSSNRYRDQCQNIQKKNMLLSSENRELERELNHEQRRNESLLVLKEERQLDYSEREKAYMQEMLNKQKNIEFCNQEYEASKGMREQLQELFKEKGFLKKEQP